MMDIVKPDPDAAAPEPTAAEAAIAALREKERTEKAEKTARKLERRAKRRLQIEKTIDLIHSAQSPQEFLSCIVYVEESIPDKFKINFHKYALPYEAISCAAVAVRLYTLDRSIRYFDMNTVLERQIDTSKSTLPFRPRWQTQPRCMAHPLCCGPLWHPHKCQNLPHYFVHEKSGVAAEIRNISRHPEIVDTRGIEYVPPQGVEVSSAELNIRMEEFKQAILNRMRLEAGKKKTNVVKKVGGAAGLDESEEEFEDDDEGRKRSKKEQIVNSIEFEQGYRPTTTECCNFRFKL